MDAGAIAKSVTVGAPPSFSFNCSAASTAYSSYGLSTVSTPLRTNRFVAGSIRFSAFGSGTSLTVTTIFTRGTTSSKRAKSRPQRRGTPGACRLEPPNPSGRNRDRRLGQRGASRVATAEVLRRHEGLGPEEIGRIPDPPGIANEASGERDHVRIALAQDALRFPRIGDHSDGDDRNARGGAHRSRERHLIPGACVDALQRREAAARDVDEIAAAGSEFARKRARLLDVPSAVHPVGGRDAHAERFLRRPDRAHGLEDLERKAHAVFEGTTIRVVATIG